MTRHRDTMISIENEEVYRHFKETLSSDLVQNVKPVIMSLTMLAEDYSRNSPSVARSIEEYIIKVCFIHSNNINKLTKNFNNEKTKFEWLHLHFLGATWDENPRSLFDGFDNEKPQEHYQLHSYFRKEYTSIILQSI